MITLTRLTGAQFALNPDLVERVDCTPDTVITLVDGTKYLVSESLQEVTDLVLDYRSRIVAGASVLERNQTVSARPALHAVQSVEAARDHESSDAEPDEPADRHDGGRDRGSDPADLTSSDLRGHVVSLEPRTN